MGCALMKAAAVLVGAGAIGYSDEDKAKAITAAASGGQVYDSNIEAVRKGEYVFLAIKPQVLKTVLKEIAPVLKEMFEAGKAPILVSMAPGWTIAKLQEELGFKTPVVRIMPNTPSLISKGLIVMCHSREVPPEKFMELEKILGAAGMIERLEEKYFDAATAISGSGPAYVCLFIEALADAGVRSGLSRDKALFFASQTVFGSAAMVMETGKHPGELKDMVTSPAGVTIEGIAALENGAFRGTIINAVEAALRRSIEMGN